ncbi:MAG: fatty acid CoA ligase family protein [Planctomycetota bacterium]
MSAREPRIELRPAARAAGESDAPTANLSHLLAARAAEHPDRCAVRTLGGAALTFAALEERATAIARGLAELGLGPGDRACLFVRPGPDLIAIAHALFRAGIVPVLVDPGLGRRRLLECVERTGPRAFLGVPRAHVARVLFPRAFRTVEVAITVGRRRGWNGVTLAEIEGVGGSGWRPAPTAATDEAAIVFTSGSTGPPKGVAVTHGGFAGQLRALAQLYGLGPGGVDVACFPLFALYDGALGMTSVFPDLDVSRPGACDPARVYAALAESRATFTFGSPAIWRRVLPWMRKHGRRLPELRALTIAGAPVPPRLVLGLRELLSPGSEVYTPYGATEALPVTSIAGAELAGGLVARSEGGEGSCVGRPAPGIELRLIGIADAAIPAWDDTLLVPPGAPGEIAVRGPVVSARYDRDEPANRLAKIRAGDGTIWHRMGDAGRLDADGRLWFLGRLAHRLRTAAGAVMPVPVENVYNTCPGVRRTALVGTGAPGAERPVLVVERERGAGRAAVRRAILARAGTPPLAAVLFRRRFPVDVRHNAKIERRALARWAERRVR